MPPKKRNIRVFTEDAPASSPEPSAPVENTPTVVESVRVYRIVAGVVLYAWNPQRQKQRGETLTSAEFQPPPALTVAQLEQHYLDLKWIELDHEESK